MKKGNLSKWNNLNECNNLLFFSQLVNELLFDYSIPSNRISTLNCHFLVIDALSAIDSIDNYGVPDANLKPIMEELYYELDKDIVLADAKPLNYFLKRISDGVCSNVPPRDLNYYELKKCALALKNVFFSNNDYYEKLKDEIVKLIKNNNDADQEKIFRLTKSILTELKNNGYSLRYIYHVMDCLFWNPLRNVDSNSLIDSFFDAFDFNISEYTVIFKVKSVKMKPFISQLEGLDFTSVLPEEINSVVDKSFGKFENDRRFIVINKRAFDPYSSAEKAIETIENTSSVYRLFNHSYKYDIRTANYRVVHGKQCYNKGKTLKPVEHTKMPNEAIIIENANLASDSINGIAKQGNYRDFINLLNATKYHAHSLDSNAEENQLLDLWSIFEAVLEINNDHTSNRINQICDYLVPILKHQYVNSLFSQLLDDIKNYDLDWYNNNILSTNRDDSVILLAEFILLDINKVKREEFLCNCNDFPLLKERINYYNSTLSDPRKVYDYVEKHANRVRWQIMRIYRNRNLIVHNASKMPYLSLLIENLHSYVDDFLYYTISSISNGKSILSMCQELYIKECKWHSNFAKNKKNILTKEDIEMMLSI